MLRTTKIAEAAHTLGTNHNSNMAHTNGLDEIDLWAAGIGQAEQHKYEMTPTKKHIKDF